MQADDLGDSSIWPPEMLLTEERREHTLCMLLFLASASGSAVGVERGSWLAAWSSSIAALATRPDTWAEDFELLRQTSSWRQQLAEHLGSAVLDEDVHDAYDAWLEAASPDDADVSYDDRVLGDLVAAWAVGLRNLVVVPTSETMAVRLSASTLLLSMPVRTDVERFRSALRTFTMPAPTA
ncbi:hypothetical protein [Curtobacterium sp. MCPF17_047]|uniref:hypothetical protein n=1 Tax=Curtobacterium sp. MCPF17_047 TaxID=2175654 RepID=UPI0011B45FB3|nr:hypothetical protein [Curtobacterium sp. MCPF17_047]